MFQFRLSKYDPAARDAHGAYLREDWTSISDVGRRFDGQTLSLEAYLQVEDSYLDVLTLFLEEAGITSLTIEGLETPAVEDGATVPWCEGEAVSGAALRDLWRRVLRQEVWCKFRHPSGFFLHFGDDLYAYVGTPRPSPQALARATARGLFVEAMPSPYRD